MEICEVCGKKLASRKAFAGHMLLAHGKRVGFMAEFDAKMRQLSLVESENAKLLLAVQRLESCIYSLGRQMAYIGDYLQYQHGGNVKDQLFKGFEQSPPLAHLSQVDISDRKSEGNPNQSKKPPELVVCSKQ